jgi:uncharacterized membrane protein (UPF0127 family)
MCQEGLRAVMKVHSSDPMCTGPCNRQSAVHALPYLRARAATVARIRRRPVGAQNLRWLVGLLAGLYFVAVAACPLPLPVRKVYLHGQALTLEVAASIDARTCGLSLRDSLAPDHGMLFVLPRPTAVAFWMRDTHLALSIAFLNEGGRILDIQDMDPMAGDVHYRSPGPVRYAIEVGQGWFLRHGVTVGDTVDLSGSIGHVGP